MAQATIAREAMRRAGLRSTIVIVETAGDRRAVDTAWGEGAFVAAIERSLLDRHVDVAVHSAKDVPTEEEPRLRIAAFLPRADPRDALVVRNGQAERLLDELPAGSRIGTDSPRRTGFLRARRLDLRFHPLSGNVDTRLRRLDAGDTDALVLACAGLDRLGLGDRIAERLGPELVPPAPGQGAIALQVRADDEALVALVGSVDHAPTRVAVEAERAFLHASGGGCRSPIGALARMAGDQLELLGGYAAPDGSAVVFASRKGPISDPGRLGRRLATELHLRDRIAGTRARHAGAPRVIVARAASQADDLIQALRLAGLEPVPVPAIEVELASAARDVDRAAGLLMTYDWVVITSANGARAILGAATRVLTELAIPRWAAVGATTRAVLEREGIAVDFQPVPSDAETMATALPIEPGARVLVLRGDLAADRLATTLRARAAEVDDVIAYRTRRAPAGSAHQLRTAVEAGPVDAIVFTSASTVSGLRSLAEAEGLEITGVPAVCIGPKTADAARAGGFGVLAIAAAPDSESLAATTAGALTGHLVEAT